jgi:hypothetical protein
MPQLRPAFSSRSFQELALCGRRAPEIMARAFDLHIDLIKVPSPMPKATHPAHPLLRCHAAGNAKRERIWRALRD